MPRLPAHSATSGFTKMIRQDRSRKLAQSLAARQELLNGDSSLKVEGKLRRMVGFTLEAVGCQAPIGGECRVVCPDGTSLLAEVVGFSGENLFLMPIDRVRGLVPGARVIPTGRVGHAELCDSLLGRVLDGTGRPLDGLGQLRRGVDMPLAGTPMNPLERPPIRQPLDVGVRAINGLLTVGRGQRMGLFAGSGVGKSVLLGMMTRFTDADVAVVGLIGERGREVQEFIQEILGPDGMSRSVVVAAPADSPPLVRLHGAMLATTVAEYFRDQGRDVLLLMDSLTRVAQAQREISLAIGEPPATKGYTPSVFARIPQLVERAGTDARGGGSITAFYTILTEGDDQSDPIAESARAILDGHVVLSRSHAESGHYPAIDVEASVSRVMPAITDAEHQQAALRFKQVSSVFERHRDLISVGAYKEGTDARVDEARALRPGMLRFLQQDMAQPVNLEDSIKQLQLASEGDRGNG